MTDSYVCLDLETTGLDPKKDKIIEIGAVRVRSGEITERMETLVNPGRMLPSRIVELTGICDSQLTDAPDITKVLPELLDFIGEDILLGHGVLFDYSFVKKAAVNQRLTFEKKGIDTLKIARKFLGGLESRSLTFLCKHFGIAHNAHRALADAEATSALYGKLTELFLTGMADHSDRVLYQFRDIFCGGGTLISKALHFFRYHGKPFSGLSGAGCFHRGI